MPDSDRVRNPIDSSEAGASCLARGALLEAWHALTGQIRVITEHFCAIDSAGQVGASGISCRLEMTSLVLAAVTSKARCTNGYSISL